MDLATLLNEKKQRLKHCNTILTNSLGEKYEVIGNEMKLINKGVPYVIDTKPDLQVASLGSGVFFGSQDPATDIQILSKYEINHVISLGVDLNPKFPRIQYYTVNLLDLPEVDITHTIESCLKIIVDNRHENIFIHCNAGVSRTATVVIAYLMVAENLSYNEAYEKVKAVRGCIKPNDGFVKQLRLLNVSKFSPLFSVTIQK